jgi:hypothetical protein
MSPDILIVRENNGFRLLHGQLHLAAALGQSLSVTVKVSGEGEAKVYKVDRAFHVEMDGQRLPLRRN